MRLEDHRVGRWWRLGAAAALACLGASVLVGLRVARPHLAAPGASGGPPGAGTRTVPMQVGPSLAVEGPFDEAVIRQALGRLRKEQPTGLSDLLHVLRLFGPDAPVRPPSGGPSLRALDVALDYRTSSAYFDGHPALIETRQGVRSRVAGPRDTDGPHEKASHVDQLLAVLAELGIPLDHPLSTQRGPGTVRELLADALANFDLEQPEIEWSALAFALYLPPRRSWSDKFGTTLTFDDLAAELIKRPLGGRRPCAGTHLLYSLAVLCRVDERAAVLTPGMRRRVRSHLARMAALAARHQSAEGTWGLDWFERPTESESGPNREAEVLTTGHQVEWLMLLPADLLPPEACFRRALLWLQSRLLAAPIAEVMASYCPYSHAGRDLSLLSRPTKRSDEMRAAARPASPVARPLRTAISSGDGPGARMSAG
jgi:hypothetical protein